MPKTITQALGPRPAVRRTSGEPIPLRKGTSMRHQAAVAGVLVIGLATSCASTGTIRGRVQLPVPSPTNATPVVPTPHPPPPPSIRDAVVYVEAVPEPVERNLAKKRGDEPAQMGQFRQQFTPRVLPASVRT